MATESELSYLYGLTRFGIQPGLEVTARLLELLGNPERKFKSIHITGTNGKGSTCAISESILRSVGYRTGLYTSPHLYTFNERIRVQGVSISNIALRALVKEMRECIVHEDIQPTFFEFTTALAFLYFARSNIDMAVIEVGMGGRYDATNLIVPVVSVITNVGLDHMEYLGPTVAHIAREKAGIIKKGVPVITTETDKDILRIFDAEAAEKHTVVTRVDDVVRAHVLSEDLHGQEVEVQVAGSSRMKIHLPLLGAHQVENMKTAIAAINALPASLSSPAIATGIASVRWEGRLQVLSRKPLVIVDGAHNADGARALAIFLQKIPRYDVLVFGAKKGKDSTNMLKMIIPLFSHIVITEAAYMPERADVLAERVRAVHANVVVEPSVGVALRRAQAIAPADGTIVVTGSLYMIADALAYMKRV